ncbi:MAG: TrkH family potassium uptake protein [Alphaproteobacteria bacterium]|nr:TrkH family potassium uptake protein [Alphaproteobacteria bacterium]
MPELRPIFYVVGLLLCALAALMLIPALIDTVDGSEDWRGFVFAAAVTAFVGGALALTSMSQRRFTIDLRQGFLLTTLTWIAVGGCAALPYLFSGHGYSFADAYFEAISGLTTTGATVITGLDGMSRGILLWRALTQGLGGVGIVVMAILILPFLRIGGMQLFHLESSDRSERVVPRAAQLMRALLIAYMALVLACAALFTVAGMSWFDGLCHAFAAVSTGGFSTHDSSFGFFPQPAIQWIGIVFMVLGSLPFTLMIKAARGRPIALLRDPQVALFLSLLAGASFLLAAWIGMKQHVPALEALRLAAFHVVSITTTTGFVSTDFLLWGAFPTSVFFVLLFAGGCSGSTAGAIKIYRFQVLWLMARAHLLLLLEPRRVIVPTYAGRPLPADVPTAVLAFMSAYVAAVLVFGLALSALGLDFLGGMSAAASALGNVGPALVPELGPSGTFAPLSDASKWILSGAMLLGRLELFTVLVLLEPRFWRG